MHTPRSIPAPHNCLLKCLCLQIYGNEELISAAPPLIVLAWTAGCAIFFALPNALMTAELATAFPEPGGQVAWVASAFGRTLGGHNGYWVWLTNILDAAVYPQMAARYLSSSLRMKNDGFAERGVCLGFVVVGCALNLGGLRCVTASQSVAMAVSLTPCLIFAAAGLPRIHVDALAVTAGESDWALLISWAVWLYSGFSSLGSMAGEVENPRRTYPLVVLLLLPLVACLNLIPFAIALSIDPDASHYRAGYFATLAGRLAGQWLEALFVAGANVSLLGLYHSQTIAAERSLVALGEDALVPLGWTGGIRPPPDTLTPDALTVGSSSAAAANTPSSICSSSALSASAGSSAAAGAAASADAPTAKLPSAFGCWDAGGDSSAADSSPAEQSQRCGGGKGAACVSWLLHTPSAGEAVPRVSIIINAMCAACLTQLPYTSLVEVEVCCARFATKGTTKPASRLSPLASRLPPLSSRLAPPVSRLLSPIC